MVIPNEVTSPASELQTSIINAYIEQYGIEDQPTVDKLINIVRVKRDTLTPLTSLAGMGIISGSRMRSSDLNTAYAGINSDVFMLFAAAGGIDQLITKYQQLADEKNNKIESKLRTQEGRLASLKHLKDNPTHREAWAINLQDNTSQPVDAQMPIFSSEEQALSLPVKHSKLISADAEKSIVFIGSPTLYSTAGYSVNNIDDHSKQSAWYTLASYKTRPLVMADFTMDNPEVRSIDSVRAQLAVGTSVLPLQTAYLTVGNTITIGEPYEDSSEEVLVMEINPGLVTISPTVNTHYAGEPIYLGKSITQVSGAVSLVSFKYKYPQTVNMIRLYPFSAKAIKVIGLYTRIEDGTWSLIAGTNIGFIDKQAVVSFESVITSEVRLVLQQPHGLFTSIVAGKEFQDNEDLWNTLYAKEYGVDLAEVLPKLKEFSYAEVLKAKSQDKLDLLLKTDIIKGLQKSFSQPTKNTGDASDQDMQMLQKFVSSNAADNVRLSRYVYELGLTEVELYDNSFQANAEFISAEVTPKKEFDACYIESIEDIDTASSVAHSVITADGDELAIPNSLHTNAQGSVESRNELLSINHNSKTATLRFVPLTPTVSVTRVYPNTTPIVFNLVVKGTSIDISSSNVYHQKGVYEATYTLKEPTIDITSNLVSKAFAYTTHSTDSSAYVVLPKAPVIEYGIVNDEVNWYKDKYYARWLLNITSAGYIDSNNSFPASGTIFDNVYYGPAGISPITRSTQLYDLLRLKLSVYSGTPDVLVERFFNKYEGKTLGYNYIYAPIQVTVGGKEAMNLSNYNGMPDSGFLPSIASTDQYRHWQDRVLFPEVLSEKDIRFSYRIKETSLQHKAVLYCNKNSEFTSSPLLRNVVLATE